MGCSCNHRNLNTETLANVANIRVQNIHHNSFIGLEFILWDRSDLRYQGKSKKVQLGTFSISNQKRKIELHFDNINKDSSCSFWRNNHFLEVSYLLLTMKALLLLHKQNVPQPKLQSRTQMTLPLSIRLEAVLGRRWAKVDNLTACHVRST